MTVVPAFCGKDCGGNACPLLATVEGGHVVRIGNNPAAGPYLKGCRRGFSLHKEREADDRLLTPLIRTGARGSGQFRQATWEEALGLVADRLGAIRAKHGPTAVLNLASAGSTGALHNTEDLLARFLNVSGGATALRGSYSLGAGQFVLPYLFGSDWPHSGHDAATMAHSQMIILWGANVLETRQGTAVIPHLMEAKARGAEIVVIDPRRTVTARRTGAWWLPCRPGTDAALVLAVLHVLITEERLDRPFLAARAEGFDQLERYVVVEDRSPNWAEGICGIPADEIVRFARAYAAAKPAMLFMGYAIQRVFAGEETYRLGTALQLATGNFGRLGGSTGSSNSRIPAPRVGTLPVPALPGQPSLPINRWPDAILQGTAGGYPSDIHAIYSIGGNLLNQGSDIARSIAAFQHVDFAVCHELFLTPTARHCDVVLPSAHALEKEDIGIPWQGNYLAYKPQVLPERGLARNDYDILCDLAERMGFGSAFSEGHTAHGWIDHFLEHSAIPDADAFRRIGVYLAPEQERVGLAAFSADPVAHPLGTPSGKVEIASARYAQETGFPAIPVWQAPPTDPRHPLRLITPKTIRRTHSQGGQHLEGHALEMHPQDATARSLIDGAQALIFNDCGRSRVTVRLNPDLTPGVVCLEEGIWVAFDEGDVDLAGSANQFSSTEGTAPGRACVMHGLPVEVQAV